MSSSTSSSDNVAGSRRIYLRILLAILVGMGLALGLVRVFAVIAGASSQSIFTRELQSMDAIPRIAAEENALVMFFGSSMVQAGFSPREFDSKLAEQLIDVTSFNFGFGGLNPLFQNAFSRRIVDRFNAEDRRLKLVMIEFNPFQTTVTRRNGALASEDSFLAVLSSPGELFDILLDDPERGFRMLGIRYLRDGISAEMITTYFWAAPFQAPDESSPIVQEDDAEALMDKVIEGLNESFAAEYPDYDGSDWYYPWRGGGTIKAERSPETIALSLRYYELLQSDYYMHNDLLRRIQRADIEDLNFDPELVENFIALVKEFQKIADHVEVVLLPKNTDWIKNPPDALSRQAAVLERIRIETGAPVRNYQQIDAVTIDMFGDTTHLNRYTGAAVFTEFLAEQYADLLR